MRQRKIRKRQESGLREGAGEIDRRPCHAVRRRQQPLFACWEQVAVRLRAAANLALFLDFDGTLVPLQRDPERVWLDHPTQRLLQRLAGHPRVKVCLISGRRRRDLIQRVGVRGASYLGLHGLENGAAAASRGLPLGLVSRARRELAARLAGLPKVWIEDKGLSFAVHYRGAPSRVVNRARSLLREYMASLAPVLRVLEGKKIWEVLPRQVEGKGKALRDALATLPKSVLPIYIGDDTTDESAFAELETGLTIRVGLRTPTRAQYVLRSPAEVRLFLSRLEAEIS